jgi:hypothetical protein
MTPPRTENEGATLTVVLSQSEMGAILDLAGFRSGLDAGSVAEGSQSLVARELMVTEEGEVRPSEALAKVLGPVMLPAEVLSVSRLSSSGDQPSQVYFARKGVAVSVQTVESEQAAFQPCPRKALPRIVSAWLARPVEGTAVDAVQTRALVESLRGLAELHDDPMPPIVDVAMIGRTTVEGLERSAVVLVHGQGFTWVEGGDRARVAFVETREDLAELVADLIGVGVR